MTRRPKISSIHYQWTYDVFLNFRGENTRHGFIGTLNKELNQKGVRTFFDDQEIGIGEEITPTLLRAIQESRMAITVFSEEYASSTFCLKELVQIHQCIKENGRLVWPVFYDVEPSVVRHQRGKYGEALVTHQQNSKADEEEVESWKRALREVANLKGSSYDPRKDYEHKLIEEIVNHIFEIIRRDPLDVAEYLVGLNSRMQKINDLLQIGLNDEVIMIGVYGNGGTGKTTITRAVYNAIADNFDHLCFLGDIKGGSGKHGLEQQQARMLSKILGRKIEIEDIDEGVELIKRALRDKKILLILDNVDERIQLRKLAGACEWFGRGSRIIITTRDLHLLKSHGIERRYEMEGLNHEESLELLSWNAFGKMQVDDPRYTEVVNEVISYASGLPLALEILGSDLYGKNVSEWKSMLDGCKSIPHGKIQQILEVSYKSLQQLEKEAFLDIACFYKGRELEYVKKMVAIAHDFDPDYHIGVLEDKCLIKIYGACIGMHDLVQDMGRDIVRLQSPKDPGKRSRLWSNKDILRVLERNEGTDEVIIIIQLERSECIEVKWNGRAFKSMNNLKILILDDTKFSQGPKYLPNSLAVLRWPGYPSSSLPRGFRAKDLVEFNVRDSCFNSTEISKITQNMKMSVLNFEGCEYIIHIPDLSGLSSLKELRLRNCKNLIEIDNSVGQLAKLGTLDVRNCAQLTTFPSALNTPSLYYLNMKMCSSLNCFPEIATREMKIEVLNLVGTGINQLPPSVENLTQLVEITHVRDDTTGKGIRSMKLPSSTFLLPELEKIDVEGCEELLMEVESMICPNIGHLELQRCNISNESLQIYLTSFPNLWFLDLSGNDFTILPACIEHCQNLGIIKLRQCKHLIEVEKVPPSITYLMAEDCVSMSSESKKLLLSKELLASVVPINIKVEGLYGYPSADYFCVPGGSIPEWFDHCNKGRSISFWFRDHQLPSLCVCAIAQQMEYHESILTKVFINDEMAYGYHLPLPTAGYDVDHIIMHYIWNVDVDKEIKENQWNHVKICPLSGLGDAVKESGIYVLRDEWTNMKNVRFSDPFQSLDFSRSGRGCATEGDIAANNSFFPSQSEQQHTHSHTVRDIDSLRILSVQCRRIIFPITIHKYSGMMGSQLGYDFYITKQDYLYITEQDVMKFLSMQELSITIIQLFVRFCCELCFFRGIVDRFGFLCPNAIQGVGHTREDKISYIGSTIKEGNNQCWLAPIREGNHWTLCAVCPGSNIIHWFDSLGGKQSDDIEKVFTEALVTYQITGGENIKWLYPKYRRQLEDKEGGYYIMRYMYDIIDLNEVDSLDMVVSLFFGVSVAAAVAAAVAVAVVAVVAVTDVK
ncbi:TMV resistance protein N-like [Neltuma alba]|uniref:TMV resistance protein N-like n=1 Tax=Neltuma alba TaxID=207710 RepID=UPI0010A48678|nr:TMV resistance protein N-like [Prosopis alba]